MTTHHRTLAVLVIVGCFSGCATTDPLEPPAVTLVDLQVRDATLFETIVEAELRVVNPNPVALAITGGSFRLELNGRKIGTGMSPEAFEVAPFGSHVVAVTFYLNNASALLRLREILGSKSVVYGVRGTLYAEGPRGRVRLAVEKSGQLDLGDADQANTTDP